MSIFVENKNKMMTVTEEIKNKIKILNADYVFTYQELDVSESKMQAVIKTLNRMVQSGELNKLSKGRFYKPKISEFGKLNPTQTEVVKDLLQDGYLTGYSIYNKLGLTTQVANIIQIGFNLRRNTIQRGIYLIKFVVQANPITEATVPLLQLLDVIRLIKEIPDTSVTLSVNRICTLIEQTSEKEKLVDLATKYPPSTRALTGAILEKLGYTELSERLYKTLNPISSYALGIDKQALDNQDKWKLI